jgi:hypothetical protein
MRPVGTPCNEEEFMAKSKGKQGAPLQALYGVIIHDCIRRGDKNEMSDLLVEARRQYSDLGSAIKDLEKASSTGKY